ncbi:hypothetical protein NL154_09100 [Rhizobium sp. YTUHZ044]|uniref:hypothetical protein n=1 Tax=Rhizobium sp. YTUHZ044 TaxID=2962678 RepID=UPI003DA844B8
MPQSLHGKRVSLIVDDTGWRNTAAFDLGVKAIVEIVRKVGGGLAGLGGATSFRSP